ncbi:putative membrane protein [Planomicrobium stackebrandtii]|uniref:Membrane protein n=1 Tax=Planomicrobium stackebrandtii TaxID=253160 RepID=A0ABU0GPR3_9BACL|nr:cytochrome c oxidase assembly protein [Planomicrobium stackebrandtii]MDQ0427349.1 putative membrane protein [Planomicrobium stackebrandtii]
MEHYLQSEIASLEAVAVISLFLAFLLYPLAAALTSLRFKAWPLHRLFLWSLGLFTIAISVTGPLADFARTSFVGHMWTHLLLGMLTPLLLLFAMPMTLLLRSLPVSAARKISSLLKSRTIRILSNPVAAFILNIGGMYMLYLTNLFEWMHQSLIVYGIVHIHIFLAGYLFTASIIYVDITAHRLSYLFRSIVLVLSVSAHKILSKIIYANPPAGVSRKEAETGGMVMYYGGDLIELSVIIILCYHWYKATAPRKAERLEEV